MIQKAISRNAKSPDFDGLHVYLSHLLDDKGGITTARFDAHIAQRQKDEAIVMKQGRLWQEEVDARQKKKKEKNP